MLTVLRYYFVTFVHKTLYTRTLYYIIARINDIHKSCLLISISRVLPNLRSADNPGLQVNTGHQEQYSIKYKGVPMGLLP